MHRWHRYGHYRPLSPPPGTELSTLENRVHPPAESQALISVMQRHAVLEIHSKVAT